MVHLNLSVCFMSFVSQSWNFNSIFENIYLWLCWVFVAEPAFASCGEQGRLFVAVLGLLTAVSSLVGMSFSGRGTRLLSCHVRASCSALCGIFLDQGWNPRSLHWQVDSYPLSHQGSLTTLFLKAKDLNRHFTKEYVYRRASWVA